MTTPTDDAGTPFGHEDGRSAAIRITRVGSEQAGASAARASRPASKFVAVAAVGLGLGGCQIGVLHPRGPIGAGQLTIMTNALLIMLLIVVPTIVATLGFAWWFRAGNPRARRLPTWAYSGQVELVSWSIPVLTILFLGGITWIGSHQLDPGREIASPNGTKPLDVQVVSLDWKWLFIYPEQGVASVNELAVPVGTPLRLSITSGSVMNAFFVPQLGSMIYSMNGMTTRLNLQADEPGTYEGLSSHFSGDGFPGMRFAVRALDRSGFDGWAADAKNATEALDETRYRELAKQSQDVAPMRFRLADANLFEGIATGAIPPGPGPVEAVAPKRSAAICTPAAPDGRARLAERRP